MRECHRRVVALYTRPFEVVNISLDAGAEINGQRRGCDNARRAATRVRSVRLMVSRTLAFWHHRGTLETHMTCFREQAREWWWR
jgi:hypothetical protein